MTYINMDVQIWTEMFKETYSTVFYDTMIVLQFIDIAVIYNQVTTLFYGFPVFVV